MAVVVVAAATAVAAAAGSPPFAPFKAIHTTPSPRRGFFTPVPERAVGKAVRFFGYTAITAAHPKDSQPRHQGRQEIPWWSWWFKPRIGAVS